MNGGVVLRRAGAIDTAEEPPDAGGRLVFLDARGQRSVPSRPGDGVGLRARSRGALAGHLEYVGPAIQHREQVIPIFHVGNAKHPWFLSDIEKCHRVESVSVGSGHIPERGIRILAQFHNLAHRPARAFNARRVGNNPARHLHRDEGIAVDVGVLGHQEVIKTFRNVSHTFTKLCAGYCTQRGTSKEAQATDCCLTTRYFHLKSPKSGLIETERVASGCKGFGHPTYHPILDWMQDPPAVYAYSAEHARELSASGQQRDVRFSN